MSKKDFVVETETGNLADTGENAKGLTEEDAKASAEEKNSKAQEMGLKARYQVRHAEPGDLNT